jgi:hypothetical protein
MAGAGAAAALSLGRSPVAGAVQTNGVDELVGAWTVDITSTSSPYKGVQIIAADGTLTLTFAPLPPSPSAPPPRLYATGYGVWMRLGLRQYQFTFQAFSVTEQGIYNGMLTVDGQTQLADDLQTFQSSYTSTALDPSGNLVGNNHGTVSGSRIAVNSF